MIDTRISVVIPTYRRPQLLLRCLEAVLSQQGVPADAHEVIVVDDGHDDATLAAVQSLVRREDAAPRVFYIRPRKGRGPAVARNAGWREAHGKLIAFTDDDTIPSPRWLVEGERALRAHPHWVALCGRVTVPVEGPPTDHARMTQGLATAEFVTANAFVWRSAMEEVGGFDERFLRAWREDSDLQFRLMDTVGPVGRAPLAEVVHPVREAPWGLSLSQQRNTYFDALLYKKHPQRYRERVRPVPPWSYYATVFFTLLAVVLLVVGQYALAGAAAAMAAALVLRFAWQRLRHTSHRAGHVVEMLCTSALIPFLSVYWRIRGALHFKVLFL
jgi:glycosyltransferase involved in cell wall biosynthesis